MTEVSEGPTVFESQTDAMLSAKTALTPPRNAKRKYKGRDTAAAFAFLAPSLIHYAVFIAGLVVASMVISTWRWDLLTPPHEVGMKNYVDLFMHDPLFWQSLRNTLYYVVLTIPLGIVLSLALALAVNTKLRGITFFRTMYFIPVVSSMVAVAVVWRWVFNNDFGLLNWFLGLFGIHKVNWLGNPLIAMPAVALMSVWKGLGFTMTLFLAGLQGIPQHLYEAIELDGAGKWQRFRPITWPRSAHHLLRLGDLCDRLVFRFSMRSTNFDDVRRPGEQHGRLQPLSVQPGVPVLPHGIRGGDGVDPVRDHRSAHTRAVPGPEQAGAV